MSHTSAIDLNSKVGRTPGYFSLGGGTIPISDRFESYDVLWVRGIPVKERQRVTSGDYLLWAFGARWRSKRFHQSRPRFGGFLADGRVLG